MANSAIFSAMLVHAKTALDAATSYTTIGTLPSDRIDALIFTNASAADLYISMNSGTTDHFFVPAGTALTIDFYQLNLKLDSDTVIHFKNINSTTTNTNDRFTISFVRS